jgi:streptomycin 6-kinase
MAADLARELKRRVDHHAETWSVEVERVARTHSSVLAFGRRDAEPMVLKVCRARGDEWRSGEIVAAFGGRGVARVIEHTGGAVLLERLRPGTALVELTLAGRDDEATAILADVVNVMSPRPGGLAVPTALDWAAGFARCARSGHARIPPDLLAEGERAYLELCHSQSRVRLLHGDLQHDNVLFDARRGWLAIDPKGVMAEPEFELGAFLRNPAERPEAFANPVTISRRLASLAARTGVDPRRALGWAFAQAVLSAVWTVEDGHRLTRDHPGMSLARSIRPLLRPPR